MNQPRTLSARNGAAAGGLTAWPRVLALPILLALAAAFLLGSHRPMPAPASTLLASAPLQLEGWTLRLSGAPSPFLEGRVRAGEPLFLPAGAEFLLKAEPPGPVLLPPLGQPAWESSGGRLEGPEGAGRAPETPGHYRLPWRAPEGQPGGILDVVVLARAEAKAAGGRTRVNVWGKTLGAYPDPERAELKAVRENAARYQPPEFFLRLEDSLLNVPLADGLALGQMVAFMERRDAQGHKLFTTQRHTDLLPPCPALYFKLGKLRERLRARGVKVASFWITSGFRTPDYNRQIGGAAYSRHCYGDAVDLCVDEDGDRHMDDLNGDGRLDRHDGIVIARACRELEESGAVVPGGIGVYEWDGEDSVRSHVHVDCRGYPVRWGQAARGHAKTGFDWWSSGSVTEHPLEQAGE